MKLKFNLGKPGREHVYFCVEQEKNEPFIYRINGKMLNDKQMNKINTLIENGNYISVVDFISELCNQILHDGRVFRFCNFVKQNLMVENV